ncbi:MAG TPA: DUF3857 domain-containing protein [Flavitalea sp.]|nr:DUF3857 domain-containing protein [Flavitalea sp.]
MNKLIAFIFALLIASPVLSQDFPDYGIIPARDIQMKECPFDKEADAVVLAREAFADHDESYKLITHHRVRLKILREKGMEYADIRIRYYSKDNFESIDLVRGKIYNENGSGGIQFAELENKSVYKKNINKYYSEVVFTFPSVKVGSIIEYTYRSTMANYNGLDDWQFQEKIPVLQSKYSVVIIPNYEFTYKVQKREDYELKVTPDKSSGRISFEMKNIPGLRDEPYMDARKDYLQRVIFQLSGYKGTFSKKFTNTWPDMIRELNQNSNFGNQIGKNLSGSESFITAFKTEVSQTSILHKVFDYVRTNIAWNGFTGIYSSDGIKSAWSKKTGHSGEINLILITLLKEAGIEAYPMLVSERDHGKVNREYPFLEQFNTVYTFAVADGKKFYLNAVDKATPAHMIPLDILNTTALVVNKKSGGLIEINDEKFEYRDYVNVTGVITPDGKIKGEVFLSSMDYSRIERLDAYKNRNSQYMKSFAGSAGTIIIDSFKTLNEDVDTLPLQHKFKFSYNLNATGDYTMIPTSFFSELQENPFLSNVRFSNINFGYRQSINLNYYLTLPEGINVDNLPKSVKLVNADRSILFSRSVFYDEKKRGLVSRITVTLNKSQYDAVEYPALQEFYKKMFDYLEEQIVIKKS